VRAEYRAFLLAVLERAESKPAAPERAAWSK
jgi:hypothetical protein